MWFSIEGTIGVGKTTFIEKVVPWILPNVEKNIIPEPVEEWESSGILSKSYTDPIYTFPAQCTFFTSRIRAFRRLYKSGVLNISERSPFSDILFWNIQESVDDLLRNAYIEMWNEWQNLLLPIKRHPDLFIYLSTSVDVCMERIKRRNRSAESGINENYMTHLNSEHNRFLLDPLGVRMPDGTRVPCVVIDTACNYKDDIDIAKEVANEVIKAAKRIEIKFS